MANSVALMSLNRWIELTERNPDHSSAAGDDLDGEARFVDAMVARGSRVLDAGCGPGRVAGTLSRAGHAVVGVDIDPVLITAAEHDHPGPTWLVADLAELDLPAMGIAEGFDLVVCAGNVLTFLDPATRCASAHRRAHRHRVRLGARLLVRRVLRRCRACGARPRRVALRMGPPAVHTRLQLPRRGAVAGGGRPRYLADLTVAP